MNLIGGIDFFAGGKFGGGKAGDGGEFVVGLLDEFLAMGDDEDPLLLVEKFFGEMAETMGFSPAGGQLQEDAALPLGEGGEDVLQELGLVRPQR